MTQSTFPATAPAADDVSEALAGADDKLVDKSGLPGAGLVLTPRELELIRLAADGYSVPMIAHELVLSASTVRTHFKNIYEKLEVRNRAGAVAKAMRLGLIV